MVDQVRHNLEQGDEETDDVWSQISTDEYGETDVETSEISTDDVDDEKERIHWNKIDGELRLAHEKRIEYSQKPSMWQYDPKGGIPTELAYLDLSTFVTSSLGKSLCFLPKDILIRICSMLFVRDFVYLSMTCRYLHWRMFTFCTCYAPRTVMMGIHDYMLSDKKERNKKGLEIPHKMEYTLNEDILDEEKEDDDDFEATFFCMQHIRRVTGQRGLFVYQPFCLRKPFFFDTLILQLYMPIYCRKYFDRCLSYISAARGLARNLEILFIQDYDISRKPFINYSDTNDFLRAVNPNTYDNLYNNSLTGENQEGDRNNREIYVNCPYACQLERVFVVGLPRLEGPVFQNRIATYWAKDSAAIATMNHFLTGSTDLIYHQYAVIQVNNGRHPLMEYLFEKFGEFEEFFCAGIVNYNRDYYHVWKKVVETATGELLRIMIDKRQSQMAHVRIGKEEMFKEMDKKYSMQPLYHKDNIWWKMETAVEPDEVEELDETGESVEDEESDKTEELDGVEESDEAEEQDVSVESDEEEESESEEAEEQHGASNVCHFCAIL